MSFFSSTPYYVSGVQSFYYYLWGGWNVQQYKLTNISLQLSVYEIWAIKNWLFYFFGRSTLIFFNQILAFWLSLLINQDYLSRLHPDHGNKKSGHLSPAFRHPFLHLQDRALKRYAGDGSHIVLTGIYHTHSLASFSTINHWCELNGSHFVWGQSWQVHFYLAATFRNKRIRKSWGLSMNAFHPYRATIDFSHT